MVVGDCGKPLGHCGRTLGDLNIESKSTLTLVKEVLRAESESAGN